MKNTLYDRIEYDALKKDYAGFRNLALCNTLHANKKEDIFPVLLVAWCSNH